MNVSCCLLKSKPNIITSYTNRSRLFVFCLFHNLSSLYAY
jgi:hypothetical protein